MQPGTRRTLEKVTLLVAIIGVLIAGAAYINDLRSDHPQPETPGVRQTTAGAGSPAIANVNGNVTISGASK